MLTINFSGHQTIPSPSLLIELAIGETVYTIDPVSSEHEFQFEYNASEITKHAFEIRINGKQEYLEQFYQNKLTDDIPNLAYVIDYIRFDGHDITPILLTTAKYYHTTNGESETRSEDYTNWLGYDGKLTAQFLTPLFSWFIIDYEF